MDSHIGVDIEEVSRIQRLIRNKRFLQRIFSNQEIAYCRAKKNAAQHFAVRFAAKEAVWKALSETLSKSKKSLLHKNISIKNSPSGKPTVVLPAEFSRLQKKLKISLSHTRSTAAAVVLFQG